MELRELEKKDRREARLAASLEDAPDGGDNDESVNFILELVFICRLPSDLFVCLLLLFSLLIG